MRRQSVTTQQRQHQLGERIIRQHDVPRPPLNRSPRKESAIEEGNAPERAGCRGPIRRRRIERAKEQRFQKATMQPTSTLELMHRAMTQILAVLVEPALRLQKREKKNARGVQQCEFVTNRIGCVPACRRREVEHTALKLTIETPREMITPQHLRPAVMHQHVGSSARTMHRRECFRIARQHTIWLNA